MNRDYLFIIFRLHGPQFILKLVSLKGTFIKPASVAGLPYSCMDLNIILTLERFPFPTLNNNPV